jgi:hypothetical protein
MRFSEWEVFDLSIDVYKFYHERIKDNTTCKSAFYMRLSYDGTADEDMFKKAKL